MWVEALAVTAVGIVLVTVRSVTVSTLPGAAAGADATQVLTTVSVFEIGSVLLPVGLLLIAALMIIEAYRRPDRVRVPSEARDDRVPVPALTQR